jgi:hypothetical protein
MNENEAEEKNCIGVENTVNSTFNRIKCQKVCDVCRDDYDEIRDQEIIQPK